MNQRKTIKSIHDVQEIDLLLTNEKTERENKKDHKDQPTVPVTKTNQTEIPVKTSPIYYRCGTCLETSDCKHWKYSTELETTTVKGLFTDSIMQNQVHKTTCQICNKTDVISQSGEYVLKCCHILFFSTKHLITIERLKFIAKTTNTVVVVPTKFCNVCNGTKEVYRHTIKRCHGCDGLGGVTCTHQYGFMFSSHLNLDDIDNNDDKERIKRLSNLSCGCIKGFSYICNICKGAKAILGPREKRECEDCSNSQPVS
jgi:hypothetical protein